MAQGYLSTYPPNTGETFANFASKTRTNQSAMNTVHSGTSAPTSPETHQLWLDTAAATPVLKIYDGAAWKLWEDYIGVLKELKDARGSAATLDARLDAALNEDGTLKAATTLSPSEWQNITGTTAKTSTTVFTITGGDRTAIFHAKRRVKMTPGPNYGTVASSSHAAGTTTVTITETTVPDAISAVDVAIISSTAASTAYNATSMPSPSGGQVEDYLAEIVTARDGQANLFARLGRMPTVAKTLAYTVVAGDNGKLIDCTSGTFTITLTAAATLAAGFTIAIRNTGTGAITIDPNAAETIDGAATITLAARYDSVLLVCDGTAWHRAAGFAVDEQRMPVLAKTALYTLTVADRGRLIDATSGTWTLTLPAAATAGDGFSFAVKVGSGTITIDPDGSELIDGVATLALDPGDLAIVVCSGSAWRVTSRFTAKIGTKGADVASAAALNIGEDGDYFHVTGTTGITSIESRSAGQEITLVFDGALTITHNGTSLILQGSVNLTTAAGDVLTFRSEGSGNWRESGRRLAAAAAALETGTWSDVTGSRALGTVYQNTSGKKRRVSVRVLGASNDEAGVAIPVGSSNPPTLGDIDLNICNVATGGGLQHQVSSYAEVPSNWYYKATAQIGTETLSKWFELDE